MSPEPNMLLTRPKENARAQDTDAMKDDEAKAPPGSGTGKRGLTPYAS